MCFFTSVNVSYFCLNIETYIKQRLLIDGDDVQRLKEDLGHRVVRLNLVFDARLEVTL
jgi:hypothetical protein